MKEFYSICVVGIHERQARMIINERAISQTDIEKFLAFEWPSRLHKAFRYPPTCPHEYLFDMALFHPIMKLVKKSPDYDSLANLDYLLVEDCLVTKDYVDFAPFIGVVHLEDLPYFSFLWTFGDWENAQTPERKILYTFSNHISAVDNMKTSLSRRTYSPKFEDEILEILKRLSLRFSFTFLQSIWTKLSLSVQEKMTDLLWYEPDLDSFEALKVLLPENLKRVMNPRGGDLQYDSPTGIVLIKLLKTLNSHSHSLEKAKKIMGGFSKESCKDILYWVKKLKRGDKTEVFLDDSFITSDPLDSMPVISDSSLDLIRTLTGHKYTAEQIRKFKEKRTEWEPLSDWKVVSKAFTIFDYAYRLYNYEESNTNVEHHQIVSA